MAGGAAAWAGLAVAGLEPFRRRAGMGLGWWAGTALMLDWHVGMVETPDGRPRNLGAADACTLARCWLVPVAFDRPSPAVCVAAFATDGLDGWLARRAEPTRIGRDLEGLVDTAFAVAALRGARATGGLGRCAAAVEATRLSAGTVYAFVAWLGHAGPPDPRVLHAARVTTPLRAAGLAAAGARRPRLAGALVGGGAAWSAAALGRALVSRRDPRTGR